MICIIWVGFEFWVQFAYVTIMWFALLVVNVFEFIRSMSYYIACGQRCRVYLIHELIGFDMRLYLSLSLFIFIHWKVRSWSGYPNWLQCFVFCAHFHLIWTSIDVNWELLFSNLGVAFFSSWLIGPLAVLAKECLSRSR